MQFVKMHGCGNDYVLVNEDDVKGYDYHELAKKISNRVCGVGSDGLIVVGKSDVADLRMYMYNSDGSRGKMCGNGIRLLGKYAYERKLTIKLVIRVETDAGIKQMRLHTDDGRVTGATVQMGAPDFEAAAIPVKTNHKKIIDESITIKGKNYNITCVSMGNPHAIIHVNDLDSIDLHTEGYAIENSDIFPDRINVMFTKVISKDELMLKVWERGSGETLACGSGACGAFAACYLTGRCGSSVKVAMPGGSVTVTYKEEDDSLYLTGDANEVFMGDWSVSD